MIHAYLSPHLDDAIFSCGGLIARQVSTGEAVVVVTVCAGDPPPGGLSPFAEEFHRRWGGAEDTVARRRNEDDRAFRLLGATGLHLSRPDAIYRRDSAGQAMYPSEQAVFGRLTSADRKDLTDLAAEIAAALPPGARTYCPLAMGRHIDHQWVRRAAERLRMPLAYYFDLPYAARAAATPLDLGPPRGQIDRFALSAGEIARWGEAVAAYTSQFSVFWPDRRAWREEVEAFLTRDKGLPILRAAPRWVGIALRSLDSPSRKC